VSDERTERRRRQIMDAVVDVTVAGGLQAATFRTIADQAGVSVRLVQYYFGDKNQLLADTLTYVQIDIAELVAAGTAALGEQPTAREVLETIGEAFLPVDERRRRAMLVFLAFGTAALTDDALQGPAALRRGQGLADVLADQLRRVRTDEHVDDDALLLVTTISGLGNGMLAGDVSADHGRRLLTRALDLALAPGDSGDA
jgi:AcrR family transcriptional regulator